MTPRPSHHPAGALVALACVALLAATALRCATGCVREPDGSLKLTPAAEQGFVTAELELCDVFEPLLVAKLPASAEDVGKLLGPLACQGQSAALKAALDRVTATAPAGPSFPSMAPATHPLIRTPRGYAVWAGTTPLGYVPDARTARRIHTPQVQRWLAGLGRDAGAEGGR